MLCWLTQLKIPPLKLLYEVMIRKMSRCGVPEKEDHSQGVRFDLSHHMQTWRSSTADRSQTLGAAVASHTRLQAYQKPETGLLSSSREGNFMGWFPVAFPTNGVFIVTCI